MGEQGPGPHPRGQGGRRRGEGSPIPAKPRTGHVRQRPQPLFRVLRGRKERLSSSPLGGRGGYSAGGEAEPSPESRLHTQGTLPPPVTGTGPTLFLSSGHVLSLSPDLMREHCGTVGRTISHTAGGGSPVGGGQPTLRGPTAFSNLPVPTSLASSPHSRRLCPSRDIRVPCPRLRTRRVPALQVPPCFPDVGPVPIPSAPGAPGHSGQRSLLGWGCLGTIYSRGVNSQEQGGGIPKAGPGTPV